MNKTIQEKTITLSLSNLAKLPPTIGRPSYQRSDLSPGILHFGVGNFHRAHLAVYLDQLFNRGMNHDFAIVGAGVMPSDSIMRDRLKAQDYLTTVVEQDAGLSAAHIIGSMIDFIAPGDRNGLMQWLSDPRIRIISLTITEGGYFIDPATGVFDPTHPAIVADAKNPNNEKTVFGLIIAGLKARYEKGTAPFTIMSCDNVPHNGIVTRNAIVGLARLSDENFADWIMNNVAFPNAMVDRITPATTDRERQIARDTFGVIDASPVFCEEFKQWVLEDNFSSGRPFFDQVGVTFVKDVTPYENMKIRILNGGHAIIAYPAGLLDVHFVHEAMQSKLVGDFLQKVEHEEIIPIVPPVPDTDLGDYFNLIVRRFSNPAIGDTIRRLCLDGSNRQPKFIVPSIADAIRTGRKFEGLALESALWCRYCYGITESGKVIEPNDPNWERLMERSKAAKSDPMQWLTMTDIYGHVSKHEGFRRSFANWLDRLWSDGVEETVQCYMAK